MYVPVPYLLHSDHLVYDSKGRLYIYVTTELIFSSDIYINININIKVEVGTERGRVGFICIRYSGVKGGKKGKKKEKKKKRSVLVTVFLDSRWAICI